MSYFFKEVKKNMCYYLGFCGIMDRKESWDSMEKLSKDRDTLLPEFQQFLMGKKLSPEKNIPFLAYWVSRFLKFTQRRDYETTKRWLV
jgi:hypothetical protein